MFFPNFMPICPVTKKCEFVVPVTKNTPFTTIFRPFGLGTKILIGEI